MKTALVILAIMWGAAAVAILAIIMVLCVAAGAIPQSEPAGACSGIGTTCYWHADSNVWRPWPMVGTTERIAGQFVCPHCGRMFHLVLPVDVLETAPSGMLMPRTWGVR